MSINVPPPALVEIKPCVRRMRAVEVAHDGTGGLGLHMWWPVDDLEEATDHNVEHGLIRRTVAYLSIEERRALAAELMKGLSDG